MKTGLLILLITLTGCAGVKYDSDPALTRWGGQPGYAECRYDATKSTPDINYSSRTVISDAYNAHEKFMQLMGLCMEAKEYSAAKQ